MIPEKRPAYWVRHRFIYLCINCYKYYVNYLFLIDFNLEATTNMNIIENHNATKTRLF